ncbi:GAF domain-containing protein, partial [Dokdonella sp.]|uniref:GAF domain-containing protein n=1 Tax=Dokdonella sp. TaxID=2291710 RepID=UPI003C4B5334
MSRLAEFLRPQNPIRALTLELLPHAQELLQCNGIDALRVRIEHLARDQTACTGAMLELDIPESGAIDSTNQDPETRLSIELANGRAVLQLTFNAGDMEDREWTEANCAWIDWADHCLRESLHTRNLLSELRSARSDERLQQALYQIANLSYSNIDLTEMLARVHEAVGQLTYAENFFVAFYDDVDDIIRFPYYVDSDDRTAPDSPIEFRAHEYPDSLTLAVAHQGRSLMGPSEQLRKQLGLGDDPRLGPECIDWLGVPMLEGERVRGAVVVQSYDVNRRYTEDDRRLLAFVAQHVLSAVSRKQARDDLELEVSRRTTELAETNIALREEVAERQRAQRMQAALYRITELASESPRMDEFYVGVHETVAELLNARNFFISLLSDDGAELKLPYYADEHDKPMPNRQLTNGITEWVLRNRRPLLATETEIRGLIDAGEMVVFGTLPKCWLGVPLLLDERAVGVMVVQSYVAESDYGQAEQDILQFASFHIATALQRVRSQERLVQAYSDLEVRVEERTEELKLTNK